MMSWFFDNYLRNGADRQDPRVNLVAADLKGLPPTTIINAQIDPLRSHGEILADKLRNPPSDEFRVVLLLPARPNNGTDDTREGSRPVTAGREGG